MLFKPFEYTQQSAGAHTSFEASVNTHVGAHMTGCGLLPSKKRAHRPGDAVSKTCTLVVDLEAVQLAEEALAAVG